MATNTLPFRDEPAPKTDEPKLIRPAKRLDDTKPVVATENDVLLAFAELAWIEFKHATVANFETTELDIVRKKYRKHYQVDSQATTAAGEPPPQTLGDRRQQLIDATTAYAVKHKKELVDDKCKTKDFGIGTVAFKLCPLSLMPIAKETKDVPRPLDTALKALLDAQQIPQSIDRKLKKKLEGINRPLADVIRVSFAWDATNIVTLVKDDLVKSDAFKPLGIKVERNDERVEVKLKA